MTLDYNSLLIALGFSGACLAATLLMSWLVARTELFLLTWAAGVVLIVPGRTHRPVVDAAGEELLFLLADWVILVTTVAAEMRLVEPLAWVAGEIGLGLQLHRADTGLLQRDVDRPRPG